MLRMSLLLLMAHTVRPGDLCCCCDLKWIPQPRRFAVGHLFDRHLPSMPSFDVVLFALGPELYAIHPHRVFTKGKQVKRECTWLMHTSCGMYLPACAGGHWFGHHTGCQHR